MTSDWLRCVQKRRLWSFFRSAVPTCSTGVVISLVALVAFLNKVIWGTLKQTHSSPPSSYKPLSVMQPRRERLPTASRKRLGGSLRTSRTLNLGRRHSECEEVTSIAVRPYRALNSCRASEPSPKTVKINIIIIILLTVIQSLTHFPSVLVTIIHSEQSISSIRIHLNQLINIFIKTQAWFCLFRWSGELRSV